MTTVTGTALMVLGLAVNAGVLVSCVRQVWRFNVRLPELWRLLESKGRAHRVRELHDASPVPICRPPNICTTKSTSTTATSAS